MSSSTTLPDTVGETECELLLEARELTKAYAGVRVLDRVSFECRRGEVHALVGENGAGKSTLVRILAGAVRPDAGEIRLASEPVNLRTPHDALEQGISLCHQEFTLVPNLSLGENLFLGHEPTRGPGVLDGRALQAESMRLLERVKLHADPRTPIGRLGIARQQQAELAKALAVPVRLLLLDEPTAALGDREIVDLFDLITDLRSQGISIVYISHRLDEIFRIADRVTVLKNGQRIVTLPCAAATEAELIRHMVGRDIETMFPARASTSGETLIATEDLCKKGSFVGVTLSARAGEILGIAGLAGSGRSELARVLTGSSSADSGAIRLGERRVSFGGPRGAIRHGVVLSPQDRKTDGLALDRPAYENLTLSILPKFRGWWLSVRQLRRSANDVAPRVSLPPSFVGREVRELSGGNQQKVMLGRAVATNPRVVVLDEPTRGVDIGAKAEIYELIRQTADQGAAVIVVSSELPEIVGLSDRVLVMRRGLPPVQFDDHPSGERILNAAFAIDGAGQSQAQSRGLSLPRWHLPLGEALIPVVALLLLFIISAFKSSVFLQPDNLENLGPQAVVLGLIALGQMFVILTGGIDLSVGSVITVANLVSAEVLVHNPVAPLAVLAGCGVGLGAGAVNAGLVRLRMPAFLATFSMLNILNGASLIFFPASVGPVPASFWQIDSAKLGPVTWAALVTFLVFILAALGLRYTPFGRHLYAVGADSVAARLRGIHVARLDLAVYCISGFCAALAGIYLTARVGSGLPNSGQGMELDSITAVMVGGASLYGGRATVLGTAAGVAILVIIDNIFNLVGVNTFYQQIFKGVIILVVAGTWALTHRD